MFNAFKPFLGGQLHIADLHIVLEIKPSLRAERIAGSLRHQPDRRKRRLFGIHSRRHSRFLGLAASGAPGRPALFGGILKHRRAAQMPIGQTCHFDKTGPICPQGRLIRIGAEHGLIGVPNQLATAMGPQMHHGRPAARHGHHITSDLFEHGAFTGLRANLHPSHPLAAFNFRNAAAKGHANASSLHSLHQGPAPFGPCIDDQRHLKACL